MLRALEDNVIVEELPGETQAGRILIPDQAVAPSKRGRVVGVGPGRVTRHGVRIAPLADIGDEVFFPDLRGTPFEHNGKTHRLLEPDEVLAVITPGSAGTPGTPN